METKKRLGELSYLNLTFCILVTLIHILSEPMATLERGSLQYFLVLIPSRLAISSVQGFIFLSGLKLCLGGRAKISAPVLWCRRFKSIVIPYVLWVLLYYCYFVSLGYFPFVLRDVLRYIAVGDLVAPFYFVIVIVQFYLLAPIFVRLSRARHMWVFLGICLVINIAFLLGLANFLRVTGICADFAYNDRVFTTYLIYFAAGCVAGQKYDRFCALLRRFFLPLCCAFVPIGAGDIWVYYNVLKTGRVLCELYHIVYSFAAILFLSALYLRLSERRGDVPRLIAAADRATFSVYLCHCFVIFLTNSAMNRLGIRTTAVRLVLRFVIVYAVSFGGTMLWQRIRALIDRTAARRY